MAHNIHEPRPSFEFMAGPDRMTARLQTYGLSITGVGPRGGFAPGVCLYWDQFRELLSFLTKHADYIPADVLGETAQSTRVLVALEGGLVQGAVADRPGVSVLTVDYDTEGADATEVRDIPQDDGSTAEGIIGGHSAKHDPAFIDAAEAAELSDPGAAARELRRTAKRAEGWTFRTDEERGRYIAEQIAEAERLEAQLADEQLTEAAGDPLRHAEPTA